MSVSGESGSGPSIYGIPAESSFNRRSLLLSNPYPQVGVAEPIAAGAWYGLILFLDEEVSPGFRYQPGGT